MKRILIVLVLVYLTFSVKGQSFAKDIPEHFFQIYKANADSAFDYYFSGNSWIEKGDIIKLKSKVKELTSLLGKYVGYELIAEKSMGESLRLFSYLAKYERQPIRYIFYLYKPRDVWQSQIVSFDVKLLEDLEEAAKAYRMPENFQ